MDLTEYIGLAPFQSRLGSRLAIAVGLAAALCVGEAYNGTVSWGWSAAKRVLNASLAAFLEEQGGIPLFTPEGEEPPPAKNAPWELPMGSIPRPAREGGGADSTPHVSDEEARSKGTGVSSSGTSEGLPNFFASTKFFSCLDLKESQELAEQTQMVRLRPREVLFQSGDSSEAGIYIVAEGMLGVFVPEGSGANRVLRHTNTLLPGESVGDLDVLDGANRSVTCMALDREVELVQVSRPLFLEFISAKPRTLQIYLHKAIARLWRVAFFVLSDFLHLSLSQQGLTAQPQATPLPPHFRAQQPPPPPRAPLAADMPLPTPFASSAHIPIAAPRPRGPLEAGRAVSAPIVDLTDTAAMPGLPRSMGARAGGAGRRTAAAAEEPVDGKAGGAGAQLPNGAGSSSHEEGPAAGGAGHGKLAGEVTVPVASIRTPGAGQSSLQRGTEPRTIELEASSAEKGAPGQARSSGIGEQRQRDDSAMQVDGPDELAASQTADSASSEAHDTTSQLKSAHLAQPGSHTPRQSLDTPRSAISDAQAAALAADLPASPGPVTPPAAQTFGSPLRPAWSASSPDGSPASKAKWRALLEGGGRSVSGQVGRAASGAGGGLGLLQRLDTLQLPPGMLLSPSSGQRHRPQHEKQESQELGDEGPVCPLPSRARRPSNMYGPQASLAAGWDVVSGGDVQLSDEVWGRLAAPPSGPRAAGHRIQLHRGELVHPRDHPCRQFYVLLEGHLLVERAGRGGQTESAVVAPGSLLGCAAYLSGTRTRCSATAADACQLAALGPHELEALLVQDSACYVEVLLAASTALGPVIRRFISLGLNRVWLRAGDTAYRQGEPAHSLYMVISGRLRLLREEAGRGLAVEEDVGRGETVGAVWALTGGRHDITALCTRDSELVRMSKGAFELIANQDPKATAFLLENMARRLSNAATARSGASRYTWSRQGGLNGMSGSRPQVPRPGGSRGASDGQQSEIVTIALIHAGSFPGGLQRRASSVSSRQRGVPQPTKSGLPLVQEDERGEEGDTESESAASTGFGLDTGPSWPSAAPPAAPQPPPRRAASSAAGHASLAIRRFATGLKAALEELFGPTLHLSSSIVSLTFPAAFERLEFSFYRSKITSWMAAQEEEYRFIILECDPDDSAWSRICLSHADCVLAVAPAAADPALSPLEASLAASMAPPEQAARPPAADPLEEILRADYLPMGAAAATTTGPRNWLSQQRRVELVLLHSGNGQPQNTIAWLTGRPHLARHHHVRLSNPKDLARVARWMAGQAVGLVLSGGGSRGLAHLGVLHALDDAGIPIDVIGGTSQGAFMAALYAQGLEWELMHAVVREYARQMGSIRHLLSDLTLPLVALFTGRGFDRVLREAFSHGPQQIEDLWLSFFCISTNLSRGDVSVHSAGLLWRLVRASMTIVGLVPPVYEAGELLVDGGYLNNMPVDVMRAQGVKTVVVVDVEDRDDSVWHNLTPYDGGLSGWRLLWDRWCPIPALRWGYKLPRYNQMVNALTWMSHARDLKRVAREYVIDLYLRPPVIRFRLLDYHHFERIVRDSNRYAWAAITSWQLRQGVSQQGSMGPASNANAQAAHGLGPAGGFGGGAAGAGGGAGGLAKRSQSVACMSQLQAKQLQSQLSLSDELSTGEELDEAVATAATMQPGALYDIPEASSSTASFATAAGNSSAASHAPESGLSRSGSASDLQWRAFAGLGFTAAPDGAAVGGGGERRRSREQARAWPQVDGGRVADAAGSFGVAARGESAGLVAVLERRSSGLAPSFSLLQPDDPTVFPSLAKVAVAAAADEPPHALPQPFDESGAPLGGGAGTLLKQLPTPFQSSFARKSSGPAPKPPTARSSAPRGHSPPPASVPEEPEPASPTSADDESSGSRGDLTSGDGQATVADEGRSGGQTLEGQPSSHGDGVQAGKVAAAHGRRQAGRAGSSRGRALSSPALWKPQDVYYRN